MKSGTLLQAFPSRRFAPCFAARWLALLLLAAQAPLAIAQENGPAAPPAAQPAPAEPGWLGAELQDLDAASIKALGLDQPHALLVVLPAPDGPAEKGGLRTADVILALNGQPVPGLDGFIQQIKQAGKGAVLQLDIWRHGERAAISVGLGGAKEARAYGNSEQHIAVYGALLAEFPNTHFPFSGPATRTASATPIGARIQGSRAENLESAIKAYGAALSVLTREAFPQDWAAAQNNLGIAYEERIRGSRAENLEAAIKAYEAALTVRTREAFPQDWATTQNNLGNAYQDRIQGSRAENIEAAIKAFEAALTVYTREAFPQDWATTQNNLGTAYGSRIQGSRAENIEAAIKAL